MTRAALALLAASLLAGCANDPRTAPLFPAETRASHGADYRTGFRLAHGIGVPRDYAGAVAAYRRAASAGDALAMNNLGVLALSGHEGRGLSTGPARAASWFADAARGGSSTAHYNLGLLREAGYGIGASPARAAEQYRLAADQGHAGAQARLGDLLAGGRGIPADPVEAKRFRELAAVSGDASAIASLGLLDRIRAGEARPAEVAALVAEERCACSAESERGMAGRSATGLRDLVAEGDPAARYALAVRMLSGVGETLDPTSAARLLTLAANDGYAPAQRQLALMHLRGQAVPADRVAAHAWLNRAAAQTGADADAARDEMERLERGMSRAELSRAQRAAGAVR